jgi:hypothetical protein
VNERRVSDVDIRDEGTATPPAATSAATTASQVKVLLRAERDRLLAWALTGAGAVMVVATFFGVSGTPYVADQLSYIASGGIGGLFLLACGLTLLVSADHHDEWRKLDRIERALLGQGEARVVSLDPPARPVGRSRAVSTGGNGLKTAVPARSLTLAIGVLMAGGLIAIGWGKASGSADHGTAAQGLTVSLAGLLVMVVAAAAVLAPSRQRLALRRAHLLRGYWLADAMAGLAPVAAGRPAVEASPETVFVAAGLTRYHLAGCPAVAGLRTSAVPRHKVDSELEACELCGAAGS